MRLRWLFVLLLPLPLMGQRAAKVFVRTNDAVVRIIVRDKAGQTISQGSGVVLKDQGWVVTNQHVVRDAYLILAEHEGQYFPLDSIVAVDSQRDIFIMAISKAEKDFSWREVPSLKLVEQKDVAVGQKVYAIGSPFSFENTMTEGIVSGLRNNRDKQQSFIQISAPFSSGSSGGAVLDKKGRLLGVSTWVVGNHGAQNLNFVIPIWDVLEVAETVIGKKSSSKKGELLLLSEAHRSFAHGRYAESIQKFKAIQPKVNAQERAMVDHYIANAYHRLGELDSAVVHYNSCLASRELAEAYLGRAAILLELVQFEKAIADYLLVLTKYTEERGMANLGLGLVYQAMDRQQKSREHFEEATRDPRTGPTAIINLSDMDLRIGRFDDAINRCEKGLAQYPKEAGLHLKLAEIYRNKGDMQKAMEHQQAASLLGR